MGKFVTIWVGLGGGALLGGALGGLFFSSEIIGAVIGAIFGLTNSILLLRKKDG